MLVKNPFMTKEEVNDIFKKNEGLDVDKALSEIQ